MNRAILLISCPDKKGITATVTNFVYRNRGNILHADQHIDEETNTFFMRLEWSLKGFSIPQEKIGRAFAPIAKRFSMKWDVCFSDCRPRAAVFVSKHLHCLYDLLLRHRSGQLPCEIACVISNHAHARPVAQEFGISFYHFPITPRNKSAQEKQELAVLKKEGAELVILARYHQILTPQFVNRFQNKIINIHHSFLPAFAGKNPYQQAFTKGVKIIGATSHYVTRDLDQGPIIEQDTVRVSHRDTLKDLVRKGEDLEKIVLSRAVLWHLERKVLSYGNKTVVLA